MSKINYSAILSAILIVLCGGCVSTSRNTPVRVFVVSGQSNAVGYNNIRGYHGGREPFPESFRVQPQILCWADVNDTIAATKNAWTTLHVGDAGAFGPEISFAHDLQAALPHSAIAIVKYAVGGTGIARSVDYTNYIPGFEHFDDHNRNWHPPSDGRDGGILYTELLANIRNATAALDRQGIKWQFAGFVWMQGEHEASISRTMAEDYENLLAGFIQSVRRDLHSPSLPFVIGGVNDHTWKYKDIARKCQAEVCHKDRHAILVPTLDLPRNVRAGDGAHFDADGMLTLGSRFAEAMRQQVPDLR